MRDYQAIIAKVEPQSDREHSLQQLVDLMWDELSNKDVSWLGFYLHDASDNQLHLGPRRDKPACSPIGMHGACGQSFLSRKSLIVGDVERLGPGYVACDPRDKSELVIPLVSDDGQSWGVLDLDSFEVDSFDTHDLAGIIQVLRSAGLTTTAESDFVCI